MTITSKIRRTLAAAAATAAVMAVGLPAAQADASVGAMWPSLQINPSCPLCVNPTYKQDVQVEGVVKMTQTEAQRMVDQRYNVVIRVWGEDTFSDDLLIGPYNPYIWAEYDGLHFRDVRSVYNWVLNEDLGGDEIYAGVRLVHPTSTTLRSAETNRAYGSW